MTDGPFKVVEYFTSNKAHLGDSKTCDLWTCVTFVFDVNYSTCLVLVGVEKHLLTFQGGTGLYLGVNVTSPAFNE